MQKTNKTNNKILISFILILFLVLVVKPYSGETMAVVSGDNLNNFEERPSEEIFEGKTAVWSQYFEYEVRAGDSLFKISREYEVEIEDIMELNDLSSDMIYIGQILLIPRSDRGQEFVYTVQPGDSLFLLARRFNTTISEIKVKNNLTSDMIYIDQQLIIPGEFDENGQDEAENNEEDEGQQDRDGDEEEIIEAVIRGQVDVNKKTAGTISLTPVHDEELPVFPLPEPVAEEDYSSEEIIVKYEPLVDVQSREKIEEQNNLQIAAEIKSDSNMIVKYEISPQGEKLDSLLEYYNDLSTVEWAEPNYRFYPLVVPTDPYYNNYQWPPVNINMEAAWDLETGSAEVVVAVIDTGVIPDHPDLEDNLLQGANFIGGERSYPVEQYTITDEDPTDTTPRELGGSHGTHVAGIIGSVTNNNRGIAGINWDVSILPVKSLEQTGGSSWDVAEGIYYAVAQGADIINLSLGGNNYSNLQHEAIQHAVSENVSVIAASGNEGRDNVYYPAAFPETIAVGAVDSNNRKTHYSNYGPEIDLVAPGGGYGESVYSTWGYYERGSTEASYAGMVGTSMAAPHVSGAAALLTASGVEGPEEIRRILLETAENIDAGDEKGYYGAGLVDVYAALRGERPDNPSVFAVTPAGGDSLKRVSERVDVDENNRFLLNEFYESEVYLAGWIDITGSGQLEAGDYFGISDKMIEITEGAVKNLDIQINSMAERDYMLELY